MLSMSTKVSSHLGWKQNFSRQTRVLGFLTRREREKKFHFQFRNSICDV